MQPFSVPSVTRAPLTTAAWVYKRTEPGLWTVGHYDPRGHWEPESDHASPEEAAARVQRLNGGGRTAPIEILCDECGQLVAKTKTPYDWLDTSTVILCSRCANEGGYDVLRAVA